MAGRFKLLISSALSSLIVFIARLITGYTVRDYNHDYQNSQTIFYANHSSNFDFVVIWAALPPEKRRVTRPVAAADYWLQTPVRRYLITEVFNAILVQRGGGLAGAITVISEALEAGSSVIIFPEGTRGSGLEIAEFKSGLFHFQQIKKGVALVPVYLQNLNRVLPKGEYLPVPILSSVVIGKTLEDYTSLTKEQFLSVARAALVAIKER